MDGPRPERPLTVIGWMEYVDLPDLHLTGLKAKIDTGARTSALHADRIETFDRDGAQWVRFVAIDDHGRHTSHVTCPVHDRRLIKNTSGLPEERIVIRTKFRIAKRIWTIDLSLTDRSNMTFNMIVGRTALKNHSIAVHTRRTYLTRSTPPGRKQDS